MESFVQATASQKAEWIFVHAMAGGISSELQGGNFGHGFISAGITKYSGNFIQVEFADDTLGDLIGGTVASMLVGGTVSELTGGKFANGARTAAYQYLYNARGKVGKAIAKLIKGTGSLKKQRLNYTIELIDKGYSPEHAIKKAERMFPYSTRKEALRVAKDSNGIPRSAQPDRTIKPNSPEGKENKLDQRNVKLYEYKNSHGKTIYIRQDFPTTDQANHFNAGPVINKLKQHYYWRD